MRRLTGIGICLLCASFCSISCGHYDPALYPSYDVLNPGPEVRANPLGFVGSDGRALDEKGQVLIEGAVVNQPFLLWVSELKEEVKKLRVESGKR